MTLHRLTIYHNDDSGSTPYKSGQRLTAKISHWLDLDDQITGDDIPEWAWHTSNADLATVEDDRAENSGGETAFLAACVYLLLGIRPLSVGDVIEVVTEDESRWVACDPESDSGWTAVERPTNLAGCPLAAETVYEHLTAQRASR